MAVECFWPWFWNISKGNGSENFLPFHVEILEFLNKKWTPLVLYIQKVFSFHANLVLKGIKCIGLFVASNESYL